MVGCKFIIKTTKRSATTEWLSALLHFDFFNSCDEHQHLRKNERNVFCIDCNFGLCRHCETAHCLHRRLQICKYVYHDVVRLQDMQKHLDCSKIQTYKINGEKAVHLNPRPQLKDAKPSTKSKTGASCEACGRYLQDLPNRFCSIACKFAVVPMKTKDHQTHKVIASLPVEGYTDISCTSDKESTLSFTDFSDEIPTHFMMMSPPGLKPRKQLHKRKGIPRRAPLC
ncbi:hypothetical protein ACOSQ3_019601 [Xanthoceras sorbifolium]